MNIKYNKSLHIALILMLMLAPLRSVFAMQFIACDMKEMPSSATVDVTMPTEHCQHALTKLSIGDATTDAAHGDNKAEHQAEYQGSHQVKSCCSDNGACMSDCHFAISVSLFIQSADFSPVLFNTYIFDNVSNTPLIRDISPLSKPPLSLYS